MRRLAAVAAVVAVALFAGSYALARAGRPQAEPPPARADAAPAALSPVPVPSDVGTLRKLEARSLPALERTPEPDDPDDGGGGGPVATPTPGPSVFPTPTTVPTVGPTAEPTPGGDGGCDPCG